MKKLKIAFIKELKNSVPFYIFVNGTDCGIIKRGELHEVEIHEDDIELYFVPKAPKFFGWKALKIKARVHSDAPEIYLAVQMNSQYRTALSNAANYLNQLHCVRLRGLDIAAEEHVKNYR